MAKSANGVGKTFIAAVAGVLLILAFIPVIMAQAPERGMSLALVHLGGATHLLLIAVFISWRPRYETALPLLWLGTLGSTSFRLTTYT